MSNAHVVLKAVVFVTVIYYAFMYGIIAMVTAQMLGYWSVVSSGVSCILRNLWFSCFFFFFKFSV